MANSIRFQQLITRIEELEKLLPAISISGTYSSKELDLTRAFCLLSHAEIETYLEDIVLEVVKSVFAYWKADNSKIPEIIFNLACNYKNKADRKDSPASLVNLGMKSLEDTIISNNGIKEHNIKNLFAPIGYPVDDTLATVLHNFGKTRGDFAHKSFKTQQQMDPQTEKNGMSKILIELAKFDEDFYKYKTPANNFKLPKTRLGWTIHFVKELKELWKPGR